MQRRTMIVGWALLSVASAWVSGCGAAYTVPGRAADFRALGIEPESLEAITDDEIADRLRRQPTAAFPVFLAVVRIQDSGYRAYRTHHYGHGSYTVVSVRDVESEDSFDRITNLPMVRGLAPLNRLVLPDSFNSDLELRQGAANVQADMVFVYTFDTVFDVQSTIEPLGVLTLGLFPDEEARVTTTASGVLMDTRTGYVYGLAEATCEKTQIANLWTTQTAVDRTRRAVEKGAFERLVDHFQTMWNGVVQHYGPGAGAAAAASGCGGNEPRRGVSLRQHRRSATEDTPCGSD